MHFINADSGTGFAFIGSAAHDPLGKETAADARARKDLACGQRVARQPWMWPAMLIPPVGSAEQYRHLRR